MYNKYYMFRCPRTNNEKRANQDEYEGNVKIQAMCRGKRRPRNLADAWDDKHRCCQRSWKVRRKKQYRGYKRGEEHSVFLEGWCGIWRMQEYFEKHDIPYKIEKVTEPYTYKAEIRSKVVKRQVPNYVYKWVYKDKKLVREIQHQAGYTNEYEYVVIGYQTVQGKRLLGYNLVWWSDKDIGIDFVLKQRGI
jgi:hypothetical protein